MDRLLTRTLIYQKIAAFVITIALYLYSGSYIPFMFLAITLGHSHFLLAYIYKLKAGKIKLKNFLIFLGLSAGLFAFFYRYQLPDYRIATLLILTTIYAIYHVAADDQFTLNFFSPVYSVTQRLQIGMTVSALVGLQLFWQFAFPYSWAFLGVGGLLFLYILFRKDRNFEEYTISDVFFFSQFLFTAGVYYLYPVALNSQLLIISFAGIYHYLVYYFHYYLKIQSIEPKAKSVLHTRKGYLLIVAASNVVVFGLFFARASSSILQNVVFSYNFFLIVTLMHFISSTRTYELPYLFGVKKNLNFRRIGIFLLLTGAGAASLLLGINPKYYGFVYFSSFFFYFISRRFNLAFTALSGLIMGFIYGYFAYSWLIVFSDRSAFNLALAFNIGMILAIMVLGSFLNRRFPTMNAVHIFSFGFALWLMRTIVHFSPFLPQAKAFLTIINNLTLFDWLTPYFGSTIVDILCLAVGSTLALLVLNRKNMKQLKHIAMYAAVLLALMAINVVVYARGYNSKGKSTIKIALVQGNFDWDWDRRVAEAESIAIYYMNESAKAAKIGARVVIWPEYAIAKDIFHSDSTLKSQLIAFASKHNVSLAFGTFEFINPYAADDFNNKYDLSVVVDPKRGILEPYRAVHPIFDTVVSGKKLVSFHTQNTVFPIVSCFEVAYHKFVTSLANNDQTELIFAIANIQAFENSDGLHRISNHIRRLALENGKYFIYVSNTGPSFALDPLGNSVVSIANKRRDLRVVDIPKIREKTIYAQFDELPLFLLWAVLVWTVTISSRKRA